MVVRSEMNKIISSLYVVELHRLHTEFPELVAATKADVRPSSRCLQRSRLNKRFRLARNSSPNWAAVISTYYDRGASIYSTHENTGAGNSVFPLLTANENPLLKLHACDFSSHAVKLVQVIEGQPAMPVIAASSAKINLCTAQSAVCRSSLGIYQRVSMGSDV